MQPASKHLPHLRDRVYEAVWRVMANGPFHVDDVVYEAWGYKGQEPHRQYRKRATAVINQFIEAGLIRKRRKRRTFKPWLELETTERMLEVRERLIAHRERGEMWRKLTRDIFHGILYDRCDERELPLRRRPGRSQQVTA